MPKTEFLQIRLSPDDRQRLHRAAESEFLSPSTWARQAILQALQRWEDDQSGGSRGGAASPGPSPRPSSGPSAMRESRRVAEPNPKTPKRTK